MEKAEEEVGGAEAFSLGGTRETSFLMKPEMGFIFVIFCHEFGVII